MACPALNDPDNGITVVSGNNFGDTATFSCDPGYTLMGETEATCQSDGTWSTNTPLCLRMSLRVCVLQNIVGLSPFPLNIALH